MKRRYKALSLVLIFLISTMPTIFLSSCQQKEIESEPLSIMIQAQEQTDLGVEPGSGFSVEASSAISEEELRGLLSIEPVIGAYTLEGGGKNWTLVPPEPLTKNTVYTFRIHDESGATVESFAFQTKSDLLVNNIYPHNNSREVSPDSGIEIVLNTPDVNTDGYFEIQPETPGTLKTNGYTVRFQPDAPLEIGNTYRITLKAGLTAPNGMRLNEDYSSKFQVEESSGDYSRYRKLRLEENFSETFLPGDPFVVQLTARNEFAQQEYNVQIHKLNDIDAYIDIIQAHDLYERTFYGPAAIYTTDTNGLEEIMSYTGQLFKKDQRWGALYAILPNSLAEGCYVVSIYDPKADGGKPAVQKLIQISNVSVYSQISNGEFLVWLNDPITGKPIQGAQAALIDETDFEKIADAETDSDGIAVFSTDAKAKNPYLSITQNGIQTYFSPIDFSENSEISLSQKYYNALYTDREIYQPTDTIRIWGALHPHTGDIPMPQYVYAVLSNQDPDPALTRVKVPVNADGTYEGHISFDGLAKDDWYDLYITDGASDYYDSKSLKIGEYTKPAYVIDVEPEKPFFYADEPIVFNLSAAFFDGTPLVNGRLKISGYELSFDGAQSVDDGVTVTLDEYGKASVQATLNSKPDYDYNCLSWEPRSIWYNVSNADAQDLNISEHGTVTVLPSRIGAKLQIGDSPDELLLSAALIDASKLKGKPPERTLYNDGIGNFEIVKNAPTDISGNLIVHQLEFRQIPQDSYYDPVNKKTITRYSVESVKGIAKTIPVKTSGGSAVISGVPYATDPDIVYLYELQFDGGVQNIGTVNEIWFQTHPYSEHPDTSLQHYTFTAEEYNLKSQLDEPIELRLYNNGLKASNQGTILYSVMQNNILEKGLFTTETKEIPMREEFLPNVYFSGAYFDGRHVFEISPFNLSYQPDKRELQIELTPDKAAYAPGEKASVTLSMTDVNGKPVSGSACVGVVDEAVFALAEQDVDMIGQLYKDVFYPSIYQHVSFHEYNLDRAFSDLGGRGGGGGAGGPLRKDFVDTALFQPVQVGDDGKAAVELTIPDNITAWRFTAAAVTPDLKAGDQLIKVPSTLPFYIQPLFTSNYLTGDDVSISLQGVGSALKTGDAVSYTVKITDETGGEIAAKDITGKAWEHTPVNFGKLKTGVYNLTVNAKSGSYSDAIQHPFSVIEQGLTVPMFQTVPLEQVGEIASVRFPVQVTVYDERSEPYMTALQNLTSLSGDRTEILAASYQARVLLNQLFHMQGSEARDIRLESIQDYEDGVKPLPLSKASACTTAKMLIAAPQMTHVEWSAGFFYNTLKDASISPDERALAFMGLAALKEPVLLDIRRIVNSGDLTTAQKLYFATGLAELGDFEYAQKVYETLAGTIITDGNQKHIAGNDADEQLKNTTAALMLTSILHHPDADMLMRWLNSPEAIPEGTRPYMHTNPYTLEVLTYAQNYTMPQADDAARFAYASSDGEQEYTLDEDGRKTLLFDAQTLHTANLKIVSGDLMAGVYYTGNAAQDTRTDKGLVKITKTYTPSTGPLETNQVVRVDLKITFDPQAPSGCYNVTDYIPSGMRYMERNSAYTVGPRERWIWSYLDCEGQQISARVYRDLETRKNTSKEELRNDGYTENEIDDFFNQNEYTLTYNVSTVLPGEFITESTYITEETNAISAHSERGEVQITLTDPSISDQ